MAFSVRYGLLFFCFTLGETQFKKDAVAKLKVSPVSFIIVPWCRSFGQVGQKVANCQGERWPQKFSRLELIFESCFDRNKIKQRSVGRTRKGN